MARSAPASFRVGPAKRDADWQKTSRLKLKTKDDAGSKLQIVLDTGG
jgi:hypothetical protein